MQEYLIRQWRKILLGRISVQDFIFCKEVRPTFMLAPRTACVYVQFYPDTSSSSPSLLSVPTGPSLIDANTSPNADGR